jgi:hypothetical protein
LATRGSKDIAVEVVEAVKAKKWSALEGLIDQYDIKKSEEDAYVKELEGRKKWL